MSEESPELRGIVPINRVREELLRMRSERASKKDFNAQLAALYQQGLISFSKGLDVQAELVTDLSVAPELATRHQGVNRAAKIAAAIQEADQGKPQLLHEIRQTVSKLGAFLDTYDAGLMRRRIQFPNWVIAHTRGRKIDAETLQPLPSRFAADIQVYISDPAPQARLFFDLPDENKGDHFYEGKNIAEEIADNHGIAGCVSDICADDEYAHLGLASAAREKAFEHIRALNEIRDPSMRIRYVVAAIFSIRELRLPDGHRIILDTPLGNAVSLLIHAYSKKYPAIVGWRLRGKHVPVQLPGKTSRSMPAVLKTDWDYLVHDLERPSATQAPAAIADIGTGIAGAGGHSEEAEVNP